MDLPENNPVLGVLGIKEKPAATDQEWVTRQAHKAAITEVLMEYGQYCDLRDYQSLFSLYTDDIERVLGGTLKERVNGKPALMEKYVHPQYTRAEDGKPSIAAKGRKSRHMMATPVIKLSDDLKEAWSSMYFSLISTAEVNGELVRAAHEGTYLFHLVRQDRDWKIKKFVVNSELALDPLFQPAR